MMDTDTACARQQVMLRAKYRGDNFFFREKIDRERKKQRQEKGGEVFVSCTLDTLTILCWNIDV